MSDIKFEIKEELGVLSENAKGWRKEVNLISWNGAAPKYDIRCNFSYRIQIKATSNPYNSLNPLTWSESP